MSYDSSMVIPERFRPSFAISPVADIPVVDKAEARRRLMLRSMCPTRRQLPMVDRLGESCQWFKVGMEVFTACGPLIVEQLTARGHSVFLDLKFHDIPNTVAGAVRSAAALGVRMVNVHAQGGPAMLEAARVALEGLADPPQLLAVTVLTSMDQKQLRAAGIGRTPAKQVEVLANMALTAGIRGFVCSAEEVAALRALTGPEGVLVTPGDSAGRR